MQHSTILDSDPPIETEHRLLPEPFTHAETKPRLESLDSAPEFSLDHLLEVYRLIDIEEFELDGYVFDDSILHAA